MKVVTIFDEKQDDYSQQLMLGLVFSVATLYFYLIIHTKKRILTATSQAVRLSPLVRFLEEQTRLEAQSPIKEGTLSLTSGFLPSQPLNASFKSLRYSVWDEILGELETLLGSELLDERLERCPVLRARSFELPDEDLSRASLVLSTFAHAYCYQKSKPRLPDSIELPWQDVCRRLNRPTVMRTTQDDYLNNWRFKDPTLPDPMQFDNLELLTPVFVEQEDQNVGLIITLCEFQFRKAIQLIATASQVKRSGDNQQLAKIFFAIADVVKKVVNQFKRISPKKGAKTYVQPSVWSKTFAIFGSSTREGEIGSSGISIPLFHVMDAFIGRCHFETDLGKQMTVRALKFPENYQRFIQLVADETFYDVLEKSSSTELQDAFMKIVDSYQDFFVIHRRLAIGYIKLGMETGRAQTNNSDILMSPGGCPMMHGWQKISKQLSQGVEERFLRYSRAIAKNHSTELPSLAQTATRETAPLGSNALLMTLGDTVYDFAPLTRWHPGGNEILRSDQNLDGTASFLHVHGTDPKVIQRLVHYAVKPVTASTDEQSFFRAVLDTVIKRINLIRINFVETHARYCIFKPQIQDSFAKYVIDLENDIINLFQLRNLSLEGFIDGEALVSSLNRLQNTMGQNSQCKMGQLCHALLELYQTIQKAIVLYLENTCDSDLTELSNTIRSSFQDYVLRVNAIEKGAVLKSVSHLSLGEFYANSSCN